MMIAEDFIAQGYPISRVLQIVGISSSSYYYQAKEAPQQRGIKKSTHTATKDGQWVSNEIVVKEIEELLEQEFVDYGYRKVTYWLRQHKGYLINEKKVYRLMKEHKLLNGRYKHRRLPRQWVKQLVPQPSGVLDYLEVDIKYIYVHGQSTYALLLTVIDVASRWVLGQYMAWQISKYEVRSLFDQIFDFYNLPERVYVRNDNGSQFEARLIQDYFKDKGVIQEFTLPATPEQNAHIESYHSIVERVICQKYEFADLEETQDTFNRWIRFYNFERIHSGIQYLCPKDFLATKGVELEWSEPLEATLNCKPFFITSE
jgi:transposase InsO family protein